MKKESSTPSDARNLEEASSAYKNIEEVIGQETDLVKIRTHLFPIAVIKG